MTLSEDLFIVIRNVYYILINLATLFLLVWSIRARSHRLKDRSRYLALWAEIPEQKADTGVDSSLHEKTNKR